MGKTLTWGILFLGTIFLSSFFSSLFHSPEKTKVDTDSIDFPSNEYINNKLFGDNMKEAVEGVWVMEDNPSGSTKITIQFINKSKAKISYVDAGYQRGASFETEGEFWEEVKDELYMARFQWEDANGGVGHILVSPGKLRLVLSVTSPGGGTSNSISDDHSEFYRPSHPGLTTALYRLQETRNMDKYGFVPTENTYYYYKTTDGLVRYAKHFNTEKKETNSPDLALNEYKYEINHKGYFEMTNTDQGETTIKRLSFPIRKNKSWEAYDKKWNATRTYVETDYELYTGLKHVIVVKVKSENSTSYEYYHRDFGLIGWGEKMGKPSVLLDEVK